MKTLRLVDERDLEIQKPVGLLKMKAAVAMAAAGNEKIGKYAGREAVSSRYCR